MSSLGAKLESNSSREGNGVLDCDVYAKNYRASNDAINKLNYKSNIFNLRLQLLA